MMTVTIDRDLERKLRAVLLRAIGPGEDIDSHDVDQFAGLIIQDALESLAIREGALDAMRAEWGFDTEDM